MKFKSPEKIILALDGLNQKEAYSLVAKIPELVWVKVGLELFITSGPEVIYELKKRGLKIFLDLKFHDIPATMAGACRKVAKMGVDLLTVHAVAGSKALVESNNAAKESALESGLIAPKLLAVTILTSWEEKQLANDLMIQQPLNERVECLANLAASSGIGGCICSPHEARVLREIHPMPFELITPGIRSFSDSINDQSRIMTAAQAMKAGASQLVVGRPITLSEDPRKAFLNYCKELS